MSESVTTSNSSTTPAIDFVQRRANCALSKHRLLTLLRTEKPDLYQLAEVVGRFVWICFDGKQSPEVTSQLSQLGFRWSATQGAWIHRCGWIDRSRLRDPRARFGSYFPADLIPV